MSEYTDMLAEFGVSSERMDMMCASVLDLCSMPEGVPEYELRSSQIAGNGYFVLEDVQRGDVVAPAYMGNKRTDAGRMMNHSSEPNARLARNNGNMIAVAIKDIQSGDEVTLSYRQVNQENPLWHGQQ